MEKFVIEGGRPISGEVTPAGNKNAALPILAACILTREKILLRNIPDIEDVRTMRALLESLGIAIECIDSHTWEIQASEVRPARTWTRLMPQDSRLDLLAGR